MNNSEKTISTQLPEDIYKKFYAACSDNNYKESDALIRCVHDFLKKNYFGDGYDPCDSTHEEYELYKRIVALEDEYFHDMRFENDSVVGDYVKCQGKEDRVCLDSRMTLFDSESYTYQIKEFENSDYLAAYEASTRTLTVSKAGLSQDFVLLHELIHMREAELDRHPAYYRDALLLALYNDLKPKINACGEDLDVLLLQRGHIAVSRALSAKGGDHSLLFFLKSLDLDLRMGYELGTVFGYQNRNLK